MARRDSAAAGLEPDGSYSSRKTYSSYGSYGSHHGAAMEPGSQGGARPERSPYQQVRHSTLNACLPIHELIEFEYTVRVPKGGVALIIWRWQP